MVRFHEGALHEILHVLHRDGAAFALLRARHRALDAVSYTHLDVYKRQLLASEVILQEAEAAGFWG